MATNKFCWLCRFCWLRCCVLQGCFVKYISSALTLSVIYICGAGSNIYVNKPVMEASDQCCNSNIGQTEGKYTIYVYYITPVPHLSLSLSLSLFLSLSLKPKKNRIDKYLLPTSEGRPLSLSVPLTIWLCKQLLAVCKNKNKNGLHTASNCL